MRTVGNDVIDVIFDRTISTNTKILHHLDNTKNILDTLTSNQRVGSYIDLRDLLDSTLLFLLFSLFLLLY